MIRDLCAKQRIFQLRQLFYAAEYDDIETLPKERAATPSAGALHCGNFCTAPLAHAGRLPLPERIHGPAIANPVTSNATQKAVALMRPSCCRMMAKAF
jgi:hypothetical protein